ncbi:low-density lipoprotein receptor-related protein 6 isoform X2 [Pocillopora verrucosa]|uniref:low-density lipoprotein receptor-related protein 6 isoform X2 n=1 Tax=Pocillopora verrucosa TaxID=203993 RepID=UPI003342A49A
MSVLRWIYMLTSFLTLLDTKRTQVNGVSLCSSPCLLVSNTTDIVTMNIQTSSINSVVLGLTRAVAIDYHLNLGYVFWSDVTEHNIKRLHLDTDTKTTIISNIGVCDGLAVHWRTSQLFWTDTTYNTISVSDLDGNNQVAIVSSDLDKPRGIALDPDNNFMFWTDWGLNPKIERATSSGKQRSAIVTTNLYHPNGLDLDKGNQRIFWVDAALDRVESIDYNGGNRKLLFQRSGLHPFGVTLVPPFLFFTDWNTNREVHKLDALTGEVFRSYSINGGKPMGVVVYDGSRQPSASSPCSVNNGGCSHFCVPKASGHECICPTGLAVKQNGKTCEEKENKFFLYTDADEKSTNIISLDVNYLVSKTLFVHLGDHRPIALDFDPLEDRVYWTDVRQGRIMSAFRNASSAKTLYFCNVLNPDGLAIDHVGRNIYWTDTGTDRIELGRLDGTKRKVLFKDALDEPRAIILDERNGMMYWTDWGVNPKIEKAEMDGSGRQSIVTGNLAWPNGLTIDQATNRLYWVDAKLDTIEMTDLNGASRQVLLSSADQIHPFGLVLYESVLYWTDWNKKSILRYNLTSAKHETVIPDLQQPMDIHVYDPSLSFTGPHACAQNNGLCSDFCLLKPGGYKCACPTGIVLKPDGRSCDNDGFEKANLEKFMVFPEADTREIYSVAISVSESPCKPLQIKTNISSPVAVDYDPLDRKIYWTDVALKLVARAFPNGSSVEVVAYNKVEGPEGLAVDYIERNLYWTDAGTRKIEVARLDGSSRRSLITSGIESPRAIILNIAERKMFWSDRGSSPKIEQANMDGSSRVVLVSSGLKGVNSLAIDYSGKLLYWCDATLDKIERVDFQGNNRVVLLDLSSYIRHPFALALSDNIIYWSDLERKNINKFNITSSLNEVLVHGMKSPKEMHIHDDAKIFSGSTSCSHLNGGCSHLCLPNPSGHQCFCPEGVLLKPGDPFTCQGVNRCAHLSVPSNGSLHPCSNLPGNTCRFSCDKGYILTGSATRTCQDDGTWTGTQAKCNAATCPALSIPANGIQTGCSGKTAEQHNKICQFSCKSGFTGIGSPTRKCQENGTWSGQDFVCSVINCSKLVVSPGDLLRMSSCGYNFGAQCNFSCPTGYRLNGSSSLKCVAQSDSPPGVWDNRLPTCHAITCPSLPIPKHGQKVGCIDPVWEPYDTHCSFACQAGYSLFGSSVRRCLQNSTWSGVASSCQDIQHPRIQCPLDMTTPTKTGQSYAHVTWKLPVPTDNSNEHLILTGLTPPQKFNVGTNHITYKVTDSSGLSSSCTFSIQVKDKEPPRISPCPEDVLITSAKQWTKVWLPRVEVTDNVGVHSFITNRPNGSEFTWGQHNITYSATDTAGNTATCKFRIIIKDYECPKLHSPLNGAKACDLWLEGGKICTLHCNVGYDFANKPPDAYFCGASGGWLPDEKVPDCSETRQATTLLKIQLHYLADQCSEQIHHQIASNFIALYTTYLGPDNGCDSLGLCTIENVEVECGDQTGTLRKRDLGSSPLSSRISLSISFDFKVPLPRNTTAADLNQTTEEISSNLLLKFNRTDVNLNISGISLVFDASKPPQVRFVRLLCDSGQVLRGSKCVSCPVGYFHNTSECQACAVDHYQDKEAQTSCVPCPSGTSTFGALASRWQGNCEANSKTSNTDGKGTSGHLLNVIIAMAIVVPVIVIVAVAIFCVWKQRIPRRKTSETRGHNNPAYEDPMSTRVYEEIEELQFPSPHSHYQLLNTEPHTYAELRNSHSEA